VSRNGDDTPETLDAVELALSAAASAPALEASARALILDQRRLVRAQIASERTGLLLKLLTGFAGLTAAGVLAALAWEASRSDRLVLEPFSVPAELAERGLTGEVTAIKVGDALAAVQEADPLSARAPSSFASDWEDSPTLEIPQTGVSLADVRAMLRDWLGRETRISGEIVRTPTGDVAVTARGGNSPGRTVVKPAPELEAAVQEVALLVLKDVAPDRYARWLEKQGKRDEAMALFDQLSNQGARRERAWALAESARLETGEAGRLRKAERAVALDPGNAYAAYIHAETLIGSGRIADASAVLERTARLLASDRAEAELAPWWAALHEKQVRASAVARRADFAAAAKLDESAAEPTPDQPPLACSNCSSYSMMLAARDLARLHDAAAARAAHARALEILPAYRDYVGVLAEPLIAWSAQDYARAEALWRAAEGAAPYGGYRRMLYAQMLGSADYRAMRATGLARLGDVAGARAALAAPIGDGKSPTPAAEPLAADCAPCRAAEAEIAEVAGDRSAADRLYARAVELAPKSPFARQAWGEAKLRRGDADGALALARETARLAPKWAEPRKLEGDARARKGDLRRALAAYAEAADRAPRWGALHLAWADALDRAGRGEEGAAKRRAAARMYLSAGDRARLAGAQPTGGVRGGGRG